MHKYKLVKLSVVKDITTFSSATIYRLIKRGEFPKQIKLSKRSSGWLLEDINAWLKHRINKTYGDFR